MGFADRILLSKCDLVDDAARRRLVERLTRMNPRAIIRPLQLGDAAIDEWLDVAGFSLDHALEIEPGFMVESAHEHDDAIAAFAFAADRPFDAERLQAYFRDILDDYGADLLRYKGVVALAGRDHRMVLQGVHMVMDSDLVGPGRRVSHGNRRSSSSVAHCPRPRCVDRLLDRPCDRLRGNPDASR